MFIISIRVFLALQFFQVPFVLIEKTDCFFTISDEIGSLTLISSPSEIMKKSQWFPRFHGEIAMFPLFFMLQIHPSGARARSTESKTTRSLAPGALKLSGSMMI